MTSTNPQSPQIAGQRPRLPAKVIEVPGDQNVKTTKVFPLFSKMFRAVNVGMEKRRHLLEIAVPPRPIDVVPKPESIVPTTQVRLLAFETLVTEVLFKYERLFSDAHRINDFIRIPLSGQANDPITLLRHAPNHWLTAGQRAVPPERVGRKTGI